MKKPTKYKIIISKSKGGQFFVAVRSTRKLYHTETYVKHSHAVKIAENIKDGRANYTIVDTTK